MTQLQKRRSERKRKLLELKGQENITLDGKKVKIFANIGGPEDIQR